MLTRAEKKLIREAAAKMVKTGDARLTSHIKTFELRDRVYRFYTYDNISPASQWFLEPDLNTRVMALLLYAEAG
jgi:hypothetical protein